MAEPIKRTAHWDETRQDWVHSDEEIQQAASSAMVSPPPHQSLAVSNAQPGGLGNPTSGAFVGRRRTARWSDEHNDYVHESEEIPADQLNAPRPDKSVAQQGKPADPYGPFHGIVRQVSGLRGKKLHDEVQTTLAKLVGLRETIHAQRKDLLSQAVIAHDHHHDRANAIRDDLSSMEPGEEPMLEDAYGHHLLKKSQADDVMSHLAWQDKKHRPMIGEGSNRGVYPYHPHAILSQQLNPANRAAAEKQTPDADPYDPANLPDDLAAPVAHDDVHDDNDQQTKPGAV